MKYQYCQFDTHEKEISCPYYEEGKHDKLGCNCKNMEDDRCHSMDRSIAGMGDIIERYRSAGLKG